MYFVALHFWILTVFFLLFCILGAVTLPIFKTVILTFVSKIRHGSHFQKQSRHPRPPFLLSETNAPLQGQAQLTHLR